MEASKAEEGSSGGWRPPIGGFFLSQCAEQHNRQKVGGHERGQVGIQVRPRCVLKCELRYEFTHELGYELRCEL